MNLIKQTNKKLCSRCCESKDKELFYRNKATADQRAFWCIDCLKANRIKHDKRIKASKRYE